MCTAMYALCLQLLVCLTGGRSFIPAQGCDRDPTMGGSSPGPMYNPPAQPGVTPPAFSFGISDRQANPGPGYRLGAAHVMLPSGFQRQLETHKFSAPAPFFGSSIRRGNVQVAAPGDYDAPGVGSDMQDSRRATSASFGFSRSRRFYDHRGTCAPGPGTYSKMPRAHGEQPTSDKPTRPMSSFSRASREHGAAVAIARKNAPGPGAHTPRKVAAMGEQINSRRRSSSGFGFGTGDRFPRPSLADGPGPGQYTP